MANKLQQKITVCTSLYDMANYLLPEIKIKQTPVMDLLKSCPVSNLDFINEQMIKYETPAITPLSAEENDAIGRFVYSFGKYDVNNQIAQIEEFKQYILGLKCKYEELYKTKSRLYIVTGLSFGIIVSLALV